MSIPVESDKLPPNVAGVPPIRIRQSNGCWKTRPSGAFASTEPRGLSMFARLILPMSLLLALAGPTSACPGQTGKVIFSEDFADDSGGWADIDPHMQFSDGCLLYTSDAADE